MSFIQPIPCPSGSGADIDVEDLLLCDVDAQGNIVGTAIAVYEYDGTTGAPIGAPTFVIPGTNTPYVPVGTLQPCGQPEAESELLCDVQPDGSSAQFVRTYHFSASGTVTGFHDATLGGAIYAPTGTVQDCDPYSTCTPDSNLDLNADCGPGQSPLKPIIAADTTHPLANAVFTDDPAADPLCGGNWDNPAAALSAPFPVDESFRNATFDQPGPVLQGTAPYPQLTAGAPVNDGAGSGWMRMSDINSGTNGVWQVPSPFPTVQGMTSAITFASHDGTTPGGDGLAFVFTDGGAPAQSFPIGGFGNLGLQNWQGGYIAVVLDEYGQTCTCSQAAQNTIDPNPGPCGFCPNTISIQLAGTLRTGATCACCTIASLPTAPKAVNLTTRGQPGRLFTSIISEGGQTFVSASIDWNDGNGPIQYFDRVNVTACAGPPPATLRMAAFGGSGGAYRAIKEYRDASARPAGASHWRSFPITTDPIPACVTLVNLTASVDVTFNSDTQTTGNGDPEAYFWLVNELTGTVVARAEKTSIPTQVGVKNTLTFTTTVPPAQIPNLKLYVGSEARDQNGEYDTLWENLKVDATGTGCPAVARRTMEISARCPIPVAIVSGGSDGGGGGTTVVNTPSSFEDAVICYTIGGVRRPGFRREIIAPDGSITVTFLGQDGLPVLPDTWSPGACPQLDSETLVMCDQGQGPTTFLRTYHYSSVDGTVSSFTDVDLNNNPYVPVGPVLAGACFETSVAEFIFCDNNQFFIRKFLQDPQGLPYLVVDIDPQDGSPYTPVGAVVICSTPAVIEFDIEEEVLCDAVGTAFIRRYQFNSTTGVLLSTTDLTFAGAPFVPALPVGRCGNNTQHMVRLCDDDGNQPLQPFYRIYTVDSNGAVTGFDDVSLVGNPYVLTGSAVQCESDFEQEILCDAGAGNTKFIRVYQYLQNGAFSDFDDKDFNGAPYSPVGPVAVCPDAGVDVEEEILCDNNGPFVRTYRYDTEDGGLIGTTDLTLAGAPYVPVGTVIVCPTTVTLTEFDIEIVTLCDNNGGFLRRFVYDEITGLPTTVITTDFAGNPYVPVGTVKVCDQTVTVTHVDAEIQFMCDSNGPTTFLRRYLFNEDTGAFTSFIDLTLAGAAYVPVNTVTAGACSRTCNDCESLILCDEAAGVPVQRITNGDFVGGSGTGWTFTPGASATAFAGEPGPDNVVGVMGFNGANGPATGTGSQTTTGWLPGDAIALTYRVGSLSTANASAGPVKVLAELRDGANNVIASQVITPTMSVGTGIPTWPGNGFGVLNAVATDGTVTVRFTDQSTGNLVDADMMVDKVSLTQTQASGVVVQFIRTTCRDCNGVITSTTDTKLDGTPYVVTGTIVLCEAEDVSVTNFPAQVDTEEEILCDNNGGFIRRKAFNGSTGALISTTDLTFAGAPYVTVGTVRVCSDPSFEVQEEVLCDDNVSFIRRYVFNGTTGVLVSSTDLTLAGAPYVAVGTPHSCDLSCCPFSAGEGCTNVGSGTYVSIRNANGTFSVIDPVTGAAVAAVNIVACPAQPVTFTPVIQSVNPTIQRQTGAGSIGVPAGAKSVTLVVLNTATAVTTVTINGDAVVSVPSGVSLTWAVDDRDQTLVDPFTFIGVAGSDFIVTTTA